MRFIRTKTFDKQYDKAPARIRAAFQKQLQLLLDNSRHPSLDAKKYKNTNQARVTLDWRFYFDVQGDVYVLHAIMKHPK